MNILHIIADPTPTEESPPKQLAAAFFSSLSEHGPTVEVENVDLYSDPPPFLSYEAYTGAWNPVFIDGYQATGHEEEAMAYGTRYSESFNQADVVVITTPMWNFSVPGILKAWLDQVISPGKTYEFDGRSIRPLHRLRKVVLLAASGETFKEDDPRDALTRQIEATFNFIGVDDVSISWADGQYPMWHSDGDVRKSMATEAAEELAEEIAEMATATV